MDKKKIAIISSIVVAVILLVVGVSYAYFSTTAGINENESESQESLENNGNELESQTPAEPVTLKYYAFGLPDATSSTNYNDVITSSGSKVFVQLEEEQLSVCIYRNNTLECFKNYDYDEEVAHMKKIFGEANYVRNNSYAYAADDFGCSAASSGLVYCYDDASDHYCYVRDNGDVSCG